MKINDVKSGYLKRASLLVLCIILPCLYCLGQGKIESLESKLQTTSGKGKIEILNQLSQLYLNTTPAKSLEYGTEALNLAKEAGDMNQEASANINLGNAYSAKDNHSKSILIFNA